LYHFDTAWAAEKSFFSFGKRVKEFVIIPNPQQNPLTALSADQLEGVWRFAHQAMHTRFEIWIAHEKGVYAEQAAHDAFHLLDKLEKNISRFIPNSDIARLNSAPVNMPIRLDEATIRCLACAEKLDEISRGVFDITIGPLVDLWKTETHPSEKSLRNATRCIGMRHLRIDAGENTAARTCAGLRIDLGGIGKGFAVDRMADRLREWDIDHALIHGGASSVMSFGQPEGHEGWPMQISNPGGGEILSRFELKDEAMGASGLEKGAHIIDPRSARPVSHHRAAWIRGPSAAEMDGLSTAFMILQPGQIRDIVSPHPDIRAWTINNEGKSSIFGEWKTE
jgi:thiamine biosynthesis lipoprotein